MPDAKIDRGWYPAPDGSLRQRFWDGSRWTVHYAPAPPWLDTRLIALEPNAAPDSKGSARGCYVALAIMAAVFVLGVGACAYVASRLPGTFDFNFGQRRLSPIPVPRASCSYLRRVRDTAEVAGAGWGVMSAVTSDDPRKWRSDAAQFGQKLARFDAALRAAVPRVPGPIAMRLQEVLRQVDIGRAELARTRTESEYTARTLGAVASGYGQLSDASDLVGKACGFTLAPSPAVALIPATTQPR